MYQLNSEFARVYQTQRVDQARSDRRGHQASRARRLSRKAARASREASLALARSF